MTCIEKDNRAQLFERAIAAETALARAEKHIEELQEKLKAPNCACSHDEPGDVCVAHSPTVQKQREALRTMHRRAQKAEGRLKRMQEAHASAYYYSIRENRLHYDIYGTILLNGYQGLFPRAARKEPTP